MKEALMYKKDIFTHSQMFLKNYAGPYIFDGYAYGKRENHGD